MAKLFTDSVVRLKECCDKAEISRDPVFGFCHYASPLKGVVKRPPSFVTLNFYHALEFRELPGMTGELLPISVNQIGLPNAQASLARGEAR